jgi:hypothetical protein
LAFPHFAFEDVDRTLHVVFGVISPLKSFSNFSLTLSSAAHFTK